MVKNRWDVSVDRKWNVRKVIQESNPTGNPHKHTHLFSLSSHGHGSLALKLLLLLLLLEETLQIHIKKSLNKSHTASQFSENKHLSPKL